jgi:hypothetical protein
MKKQIKKTKKSAYENIKELRSSRELLVYEKGFEDGYKIAKRLYDKKTN